MRKTSTVIAADGRFCVSTVCSKSTSVEIFGPHNSTLSTLARHLTDVDSARRELNDSYRIDRRAQEKQLPKMSMPKNFSVTAVRIQTTVGGPVAV